MWKRFVVGDQERFLITKNGRFGGILSPGEYRMFVPPGDKLETEKYNLRNLVFDSSWANYLVKERPELVDRYFTRVETNDVQIALVYVNAKLFTVLTPAKRVLFWREAGDITAEVIDVIAEPEVPAGKMPAMERVGRSLALFSVVEEAKTGLLFIDNRFVRTLPPGKYGFWAVAAIPRVEIIDLRRQMLEVPGQEILSRDKVGLRVNILAEYQVRDAVKAKQTIKDFEAHLYRLLQLTIRQALGRKTLEEILAEKTEIDEATISVIRAEMIEIGVEVGAIALKDIILPGEMREIMNQVVSAQKQAQANLIRRRGNEWFRRLAPKVG